MPAQVNVLRRLRPLLLLPAILTLGLAATACDDGPPSDPPDTPGDGEPRPGAAPATPLRRLTAEELNRTLRDLFPSVAVPVVVITEDNGKDFAQETPRQVVSDLHVEELRAGVNDVAAAVAAAVARDPLVLFPRAPGADAADAVAVVDAWLTDFLPRAFRRSVDDAERTAFVDFFAARAAVDNANVALQVVLQGILQHPAFLYRLELAEPVDAPGPRVPVSSVELATRLAYFLWGTMPDDALLQKGIDGELEASGALLAEAQRMLADPRATDAILSFHRQWLEFDRVLRTNKDASRFPQYNEFIKAAMRREADRFIEHIFATEPTLRALLTSRQTRLLPGLGPIYGVDVPEDDALVELPPDRAGILTQAQFLAGHAHAVEGSPVLRGVFVLERLVCAPPGQPSGNIDITPPSADDGDAPATNRARYAAHVEQPSCKGCHASIDGIGFGLEAYDAVGQHRTTDGGQPVDDSGSLEATAVGGTFTGARELGERLAESPVVADCVARHWFRFANGRREGAGDATDLAQMNRVFADNGGDIRALLLAIVQSEAFRTRSAAGD